MGGWRQDSDCEWRAAGDWISC